ncbi:hypothetical protein PVA17_07190 [Lysinibacillus sp. CNPSo 3705]|uniref:hypothetical protein n=1 Tax=Lysinibacillus sp. CNPSo 3705 TaxID=3028148 RepID=UPI0023640CE1|nr:hypothetical protein [Lysinibacillus sp. CNPSo 3705]MDD1502550.1 hypothetical protein [Lysinibacillus sp. CNPSo 3705]
MLPLRFRTEKTFVTAASLSHRKNICCCRFAFAQKKHLLLPLRFRTEKTFVTAASLSHRKNICCCRFAFAQKKHLLLPLRFRTEQSFLGLSDEPLLVLLSLRFRTENIRFAAGSRANTMLVTKALSQDVMLLAFVPLLLIPEKSLTPIYYLHSRRFNKSHPQLLVMNLIFIKRFSLSLYIMKESFYRVFTRTLKIDFTTMAFFVKCNNMPGAHKKHITKIKFSNVLFY